MPVSFTRRNLLTWLGAGALTAALPGRAFAKSDEIEPLAALKLATMNQRDDPWGKVLSVWARHLEKASNGQLDTHVIHDGGDRGLDEEEVTRRLLAGVWDGGVVTATGLYQAAPAAQVLQLPGLFGAWADVEGALGRARPEIDRQLAAAGLTVLGWGNVGSRYLFTRGVALRSPADMGAQQVYLPKGDLALQALYEVAGVPAPLTFDEAAVRHRLNKAELSVVPATLMQAESRGWLGAPRLDQLVAVRLGVQVAALVVRTDALDALPSHLRGLVLETGPLAASGLTTRTEELEAAALARVQQLTAPIELAEGFVTQWDDAFKAARERLVSGGAMPQALVDLMAPPAAPSGFSGAQGG
jgi:TRAP-type C4-dicarboxylate transport system substrate-binding protein